MTSEPNSDSPLELAHVLFTDIVGYSKLLGNQQRELFQRLNGIVCGTRQFQSADAAGKLVRLPTGDGMALAFFTSPDAPVRCACEISRKLQEHPEIRLRMGINAGLGRKEEAIREALQAVDLLPIAKDSYWGPGQVTNLALVYAWTGERDRALEQLEVVAKIPVGGPAGPTYGDLKFNPCWDSLRGDPRFEKIVASLAPK